MTMYYITLLVGGNVLGPMTSRNVYSNWDKPPTSSLCVSMSWWVHSWRPADEMPHLQVFSYVLTSSYLHTGCL